MNELSSVEAVGSEQGTIIEVLGEATADNMTTGQFTPPSTPYCISSYQPFRNKLQGNFRITIRGIIQDKTSVEYAASGNPKVNFTLVDPHGYYLNCCAMHHNVTSYALQDSNEVVLYFATGRPPIGNTAGALYLYKDAIIVPVASNRLLHTAKTHHIQITEAPSE